MREKSLYQLGVEYEKAAALVKERIENKRKQLNSLKNRICSNEAYVLKSELNSLYREYRETVATAKYLKHYYEENNPVSWGGIAA